MFCCAEAALFHSPFSVQTGGSPVTSLVLSRLDYVNATLAGIPQHLWRLQSVMNAAVRLIYSLSRFDHITLLLRQHHWLTAKERIDFKLAVLVFKCVHGFAPPYLADELSRPADFLGNADFARYRHPNDHTGHSSNSHYNRE